MRTRRPKTILLADDSLIVRRKISDILIEAGHNVILAGDGKEAKKKVRKNFSDIDLLILDIVLPYVDGFGVLRWMKEKGYSGRFPVLAISGVYKPGDVVNRLKALGASGVMTKRFTPEQVIHHVHLMLYPRKRDRRLVQRAPTSVPVTFTIKDTMYKGRLMNIGTSGLFLRTKTYLLAGTALKLAFSLPGSKKTFKLKGRVEWATTLGAPDRTYEGAGIAFTSISNNDREELRRFIEEENKKRPLMP
ncbi:MAG: response regulator [Thermodesulfobacteriota bacterium]